MNSIVFGERIGMAGRCQHLLPDLVLTVLFCVIWMFQFAKAEDAQEPDSNLWSKCLSPAGM